MNTIVYLYHGRESEKFVWERWPENDYCLIRLGIPGFLWRKRNIWQDEEWTSRLITCLEELYDLQIAFTLLGDSPYRTYCVYEAGLYGKINREIWCRSWQLPMFEDYREHMWVEKLMQYAIHDCYLVLGYADCLPRLLCENAAKMRSVKWFLKETHYSPEMQEFTEEFFEEYGLAVEVHLLEEEWIRVRPSSAVPVNVLDFTGEEKLSVCDVAKGSVWLDMDSLDGKSRRIEAGNPGIGYFSLKNQWKQRQKESIYLDTISKNGYNT